MNNFPFRYGIHNFKPQSVLNNSKRLRQNDSDASENEHSQPTTSSASPRFLVIYSQEERSVSSLSLFVIEKVLDGMIGTPKNIKNYVQVTTVWNMKRKGT